MWFTSPRMIRGWFTDIPSWRGRDGIRIPEFGSMARILHSDSGLGLGGSAGLDGAGIIGDSIGTTAMQFITTAGTTHGATRFTTGTLFTAEEGREADLTGRGREHRAIVAELSIVLENQRGLSTVITTRHADTLHLAVKAGRALAHSAGTSVEEIQGATLHAGVRALAAEEERAGAAVEGAGVINKWVQFFLPNHGGS